MAQQRMMNGQLHLGTDLHLRGKKTIQSMIDHAFRGIFHRHHTVMHGLGFHFAEDFINGGQRLGSGEMAELLDRRSFGKRTLGAKVSHRQGQLEIQAAGDDFAEQRSNVCVAQRPGVTRHQGS